MKKRKRVCYFKLLFLVVISFLINSQAFAGFIQGTSTATLVEGGEYDGWYRYDLNLEWDLDGMGAGLSHWDLILKTGCREADHLIEFPVPAGYSTSEEAPDDPMAMGWSGYFLPDGDPALDPPTTEPVLKYNEPHNPFGTSGAAGYGTFSFYSNIIPEYGTYLDVLVGKAGTISDTYGPLEGAYPSCTVPEPGTILLLSAGALALSRKKKSA